MICAPERTWRHLDTMQFTTLIRARTPRSDCPEHGVKTMPVPWAAPQGRFTRLFERFAVEVLLAAAASARPVNCWDQLGHGTGDHAPGRWSEASNDGNARN